MSSRATKRRIWRRVRAQHCWWWVPMRDVVECRCGLTVSGQEFVAMGDVRAGWMLYGHFQDAYRAEQRKEARRCP